LTVEEPPVTVYEDFSDTFHEDSSDTAHEEARKPIVEDSPVNIGKKLRCIAAWKIFLPEVPKMPPSLIHAAFDHAFDEWLDDYEEVSRAFQRIPTVDDLLKDKISDAEFEEASFMVMPQPIPGSPATMPGYDPWRVTVATGMQYGVQADPYGWAETKTKHIYVSTQVKGMWMFRTADAAIVIQWKPSNQVWWCEEFGFGFHQNTPEEDPDHPCRYFFGQFNDQDQHSDMWGPARTKDPAGPYWRSAVEEFWTLSKKLMDEEQEQKKKLETEWSAANMAALVEQEMSMTKLREEQRRREEGANRMRMHQERLEKEKEGKCLARETPQMLEQGDYDNTQYQATHEDAPRQSGQQRGSRMTPAQAAAENRRKAEEQLASWGQRKPEEKKKAVFGEKMF
jgi:hypothetical protein